MINKEEHIHLQDRFIRNYPVIRPPNQIYPDIQKTLRERLKDVILDFKTGSEKFSVFNLEPSLGKSVQTNNIVIEHILNQGEKPMKFLIIKPFDSEVYDCAEAINRICPNSALPITAKEWREYSKSPFLFVVPYRVIVITHQRFINLCLNDYLRQIFSETRDILIIDEKINFPNVEFSESKYSSLLPNMEWLIHDKYVQLCNPILSQMEMLKNKTLSEMMVCEPEINTELLSTVRTLIENCGEEQAKKQEIQEFLDAIEIIASSKCIFSLGQNGKGFIRTFNRRHKLWGLKNNVILDATGGVDKSYQISNQFIIHHQDKVIDHSQSNLYWINCNSSRSFIDTHKKLYLDSICGTIKERINANDKTLLIIQKRFEKTLMKYLKKNGLSSVGINEDYIDEEICINHFGNLIGKDDYGEFNKCFILGTFNLPLDAYILKWYQYSGNEISDYKRMSSVTDNISRKLTDEDFEQLRISILVSDVYQCLKRIGRRTLLPNCEMYITTNSETIFNDVANELNQINIGNKIDICIGKKSKGISRSFDLENLIHYLVNLMQIGPMSKQDIRHQVGIEDGKNLGRHLKHPRIKELENNEIILIGKHTITKLRKI